MAQKIIVQDGNVVYSAADPSYLVNVDVEGQMNVTKQLNVGDEPDADGVITTPDGGDLIITTTGTGNVRLEPSGALLLNNAAWPTNTVSPGQFIGSSSPGELTYYNFIIAYNGSDDLTDNDLNNQYPDATPGQSVLGPTVLYYCVGSGIWRKLCTNCGGNTPVDPIIFQDFTMLKPGIDLLVGQQAEIGFAGYVWEGTIGYSGQENFVIDGLWAGGDTSGDWPYRNTVGIGPGTGSGLQYINNSFDVYFKLKVPALVDYNDSGIFIEYYINDSWLSQRIYTLNGAFSATLDYTEDLPVVQYEAEAEYTVVINVRANSVTMRVSDGVIDNVITQPLSFPIGSNGIQRLNLQATRGFMYSEFRIESTGATENELPPQTGHAGEVLYTNGTSPYWAPAASGGAEPIYGFSVQYNELRYFGFSEPATSSEYMYEYPPQDEVYMTDGRMNFLTQGTWEIKIMGQVWSNADYTEDTTTYGTELVVPLVDGNGQMSNFFTKSRHCTSTDLSDYEYGSMTFTDIYQFQCFPQPFSSIDFYMYIRCMANGESGAGSGSLNITVQKISNDYGPYIPEPPVNP